MQWREAHDPQGYGGQESIFPITLRVLQQLDPEGKVRASDELKEVARLRRRPVPRLCQPTYGVYEQIVEFTAPADGSLLRDARRRHDLRLRCRRSKRHLEIQPRLYAEFSARRRTRAGPCSHRSPRKTPASASPAT